MRLSCLLRRADRLPGGLGDDRPDSDFDPEQLAMGLEVEREHTSDPEVAREIVHDHLTEDPAYYTKLKTIEGQAPPPPPPAAPAPSPTDGSRPAPAYRSPNWKRPKNEPKYEDLQAASVSSRLASKTVVAYHGSAAPISRFDPKRGAQSGS